MEIGKHALKCLEIHNPGELTIDFEASVDHKGFGLATASGSVRPNATQRLLVHVNSPTTSKRLSGTLTLEFNKEHNKQCRKLKMHAEFGTRQGRVTNAAIEFKIKFERGQEEVHANEMLAKTKKMVRIQNPGSLPLEVWLQPHLNAFVIACGDNEGRNVVEPKSAQDFEIQLSSLPPGLRTSTGGEVVFKTNSQDPAYAKLKLNFTITIQKAMLHVKPWGCMDLGAVPKGSISSSFSEQ